MTVYKGARWGTRTPGDSAKYVLTLVNLFAHFWELMSSLWVPHPVLRSRGRRSPPSLGSPVTPCSIHSSPSFLKGWDHTRQFGESVQVSNHADFPDLYQSKLDFLQTACNKSSYILSPHKNKSRALSRSLYFKPAQVTSDPGSSCFNSALQAHSSCARHERQTFCLTCSFSSSIHSFKTKLFREDFTAFSAKKDIFSLKSTDTNNSPWHKITEKAKALSLHCEMNLQTSTTYSPHREPPSALLSFVKVQALCPVFLGKVNYPQMKIHAISPQCQQALGQYSKNIQSEGDQTVT